MFQWMEFLLNKKTISVKVIQSDSGPYFFLTDGISVGSDIQIAGDQQMASLGKNWAPLPNANVLFP